VFFDVSVLESRRCQSSRAKSGPRQPCYCMIQMTRKYRSIDIFTRIMCSETVLHKKTCESEDSYCRLLCVYGANIGGFRVMLLPNTIDTRNTIFRCKSDFNSRCSILPQRTADIHSQACIWVLDLVIEPVESSSRATNLVVLERIQAFQWFFFYRNPRPEGHNPKGPSKIVSRGFFVVSGAHVLEIQSVT
jgi:hypothetical protein